MSNSYFNNNVIFPGNQVTHLNAYRNQGVQAIPGVNFFRMVGAIVVDSILTSGTHGAKILSPDQRQDDKPRLDRAMTVPAGATIYRTAISCENLSTTSAGTVAFPAAVATGVTLTAGADGKFSEYGTAFAYDPSTARSPEGSDRSIEVELSNDLTVVDSNSQAAVLVEVCFYMDAHAPCTEDVHLPYKTEAGQGY
jgi:hypothetical protein|tara:strand:+ start:408 stop:992 length:585 start_codon:yes stop_codon:yes gene_type:complete